MPTALNLFTSGYSVCVVFLSLCPLPVGMFYEQLVPICSMAVLIDNIYDEVRIFMQGKSHYGLLSMLFV